MSNPITRSNHYVPQWYQKGFHAVGESKLQYLDLSPERKLMGSGKTVSMNALNLRGPKMCFCENDLYSLHFGAQLSDVIERRLFDSIDLRGAKAVRAFVDGDLGAIHLAFQDFFEYMDVQKLRTPKGLDWIKSCFGVLDQHQLMIEMQELRLMHCTMWTEGVREIVSAEDSEVKFIVSDHPVTLYNAGVPPGSPKCQYPSDPPLDWMGTHTVFVLDANTCLILTHLEYANGPDKVRLDVPRTNARYRGQGLVRTDAFIRKRRLSSEEVTAINHLLKSRAKRYVAAARERWLFPETSFIGSWRDIAEVLRPRDELYRFGGELIVGHKDGTSKYQDEFGRTSGSHKYLRKKPVADLSRNDPCGCGSGFKFKRCCESVPEVERPSWTVFSIRERNLMFCQMVKDVLGLRDGKDWIDVRRELSDEQVKEIHEAYASLWPEDTSLSELLPRPRSDVLRAVYLGPVDSRSIGATVLGWLPVFDQIVVASPFVNPLRIREQYSPTKSPSKFKFQTLRNVLLLLRLEPFIFSGDLHMVPDPSDFDSQYGQSVMRSADRLAQGIEALPKLGGWPRLLAADEMRHLIRGMPEEELRRMLRKSNSGITEQMLAACVEMNKAELEADPFALLQPMLAGEEGSQYLAFKGYGLATAMYLAALSGAVIYTDEDFHWKQLHQLAAHAPLETLMPLIQGVLPIEFSIDVNSHMLELRLDEGKFGHLKAAFRRVAAAVSQSSHSVDVEYLVAELAAAAQSTNVFKGNDVEQRELAGRIEISAPSGGFISNDVGRLLLTFGKAPVNRPMPFAMRIIFDRLNELDDHDDSPASA